MKLFNTIFFAVLQLLAYSGYSGDLQGRLDKMIDWGNSVEGVQLSVNVTNNMLQIGSRTAFVFYLTNSSTSIITIAQAQNSTSPEVAVELISESGKSYLLTPMPEEMPAALPPVSINVRELREWQLPLSIVEGVKAGDYIIKASVKYRTEVGRYLQLTSNSLKVSLIK